MELNEAIFTQLSGYAGLSALVARRIYPGLAAQGTVIPYVTYQRIAQTLYPTYAWLPVPPPTLAEDLVQFDCYGLSADAARAVATQLKAALIVWTTSEINRAFPQHDRDLYESDTKLFRVSVDALIWNVMTHP